MTRLLLLVMLVSCATVSPRPPTASDVILMSTAFGLYAIDAAQSLQAQGDYYPNGEHKFTEGNWALGSHPGAAKLIAYDVFYSAAVLLTWAVLPPKWRLLPLIWLAGNETYEVIKSLREGVTPWSAP